jgi:hypothetical protein
MTVLSNALLTAYAVTSNAAFAWFLLVVTR